MKMSNVLLSVIIPCYNNFHLMQKGLESLEKLDKNCIEVIIIDDNSTDDSYRKLLSYSQNSDLNIKVIRNEKNSGPGVSRNNGIKISTGEYITFLDADDFFCDIFWENIFSLINKRYDCIVFDAYIYYDKEKNFIFQSVPNESIEGLISVNTTLVNIAGATWGKIYRRDIIELNKISFLPQMRCEDLPFTKHAISCCTNIYYLKKPLYMYVQNSTSLTHNDDIATPKDGENAAVYIKTHINSVFNDEIDAILIKLILYSVVLSYAKTMKVCELKNYIKNFADNCPNYQNNKYLNQYSKDIRLFILLVYKKNILGIKLYMLLRKFAKNILQKHNWGNEGLK